MLQSFFNQTKYLVLFFASVGVGVLFQNCGQPGRIVDSEAANKINGITLIGMPSIRINNGALYTNSKNVMLQLMAPGAEKMMISNNSDCESADGWEDFTENKPWVLGNENRDVSVYARFKKVGVPETECVEARITHDNIKPEILVNQKPASVTNAQAISIPFAALDTGSGIDYVVCRNKEGVETACQTQFVFSNLTSEGSYEVLIRAYDKAGNESVPVREAFIVDRTAPVITINGPQGRIAQQTAQFNLSVAENNGLRSVQCRLSPVETDYKDCSSLKAEFMGLATNSYVFEVRAVDMAGNSAEGKRQFQVDLTVPTVRITKGPALLGNMRDVGFIFDGTNGSQILTSFKCGLDMAATTDCSSPKGFTNLIDKKYSFRLKGLNDLGVESAEQLYEFTIDTTAPTVKIVSAPSGRVTSNTASISIEADDLNGIKSVECSLNGGAFEDCSSKLKVYSSLANGSYTFVAKATDNAGNQALTNSVSWIVDITPPSEILANMAQNPIREGSTGTLNIKLTQVTGATYACSTVAANTLVKQGPVSGTEMNVSFTVNEDINCLVKGFDKNSAEIKKSVEALVSCGNRIKQGNKCVDFTCKSVQALSYVPGSPLNVPARTADGICYSVKLFNSIASGASSLNTSRDLEVIARNHDASGTKSPYILNKALINFILAGPRTAKLSGGLDASSPILVDNFVLSGLYPQSAVVAPSHYKAYGTKDSTVDTAETYVLLKNSPIGLTPFNSAGTATLNPLEIVREADTNLNYILDIRALDCGGSRRLSEIYLLFQ